MEKFKISKKYWDRLNEKEKMFLQINACDYGVRYCKRILSLANYFDWTEIVNFSVYIKKDDLVKPISNFFWIVFNNNQIIGLIRKCDTCEAISIKKDNVYIKIWEK